MTTRAKGPLAGLGWLKRGINLGRHNPKAIFGGAALLALVALVPGVLQLIVQTVVKPGPDALLVVMAVTTLLSIVLMPPMIGGYLRVIDAAEHGRATGATEVFAPFRHGQDGGRLIGFGVAVTLIYLALAFAVIGVFGDDLLQWYLKVMALSQQGQPVDPKQVPPLPAGLGPMLGLGSLIALFLGGVYAIGFGQVALGKLGVGRALADGVAGTLKNLLPLVVLAVISMLLLLATMLAFGMVIALVALVGGLIHPSVAVVLAFPVYMLLLLVLYVVMFGVMYHLWRDVTGVDEAPVAAGAPGHIEL